ncbi:NADH-quinone oxidoreductase subunit M [Jatrophihabitans cynanchi]|uniref:NADH-quinone oxidoreductase subunit M n=2 Tax=Jatrophihabitans cynanchi TaxID=2944128 RepID=A0ABY7K712_9ACTN|nr:NADH-quinone oxidoreductase subunit M [Jatrophihabitans sp. SB3-54]WAX59056.1 NADH-quinone oxidoreductase subunit M [Jatrophihabitans sp. SB3-54]
MNNVALVILVLIPLAGSGLVFSMKDAQATLAKQVTLAVSLIVVVYTAVLGFSFDTGKGADRFQFQGSWVWIKSFGVHLAFGLDGIALVLVAMSVVLVPAVILASWNSFDSKAGAEELPVAGAKPRSVKNYFGLLLLLEFFMIGVFTATDVFLFYVFFEAMLVPMYFIIGSFGGPRRQYAAMKFFLYSLVGGLLMLASVIGLYITTGSRTFAIADLIGKVPDNATQKWLFLGFFIAFAIKAPLVPFHTWLPDAGAEAPAGGAALLVGVLDKVGTFGFLRYCLPLFPAASRWAAPTVLILSVIGVLYAAFLAIGQRDMKRLVAYTSVAHFGFIGLGIFAFTSQGGSGAVLYMVNHGLSTGAVFIVVGLLIARGKSRNIDDYGGAAKVTPLLAGLFLFAGMSALALPGLSTFVSEFLVLVGSFTRHKGLAILAATGIVLAAIYVLYLYQRTFQGAVSEKVTKFRDLNAREVWAVAPLLVLIVFLGIFPKPVLDVINPAVQATLHDVQKTDPAPKLGTVAGPRK